MNLRTPDVDEGFAQPVPYAKSIERAGASLKEAADKWAAVDLEMEKANVIVQTQEAALQTTKGLNDLKQFYTSNPYVAPEQVKQMFGGSPPPEISLDEDVAGPDGKMVRQPRAAIPMHEVLPHLFARASSAVAQNAASSIEHEGWRSKFEEAQAMEVERARSEMMDWQRAQRLADFHVRTQAQLEQAAAQRNWDLYKVILDTPENHLGAAEREKLRGALPELMTKSLILDRLRSVSTVEDADKLISDIQTNRTETDQERGPFYAPLSAQDQYTFLMHAKEKKQQIVHDALEAAKQAKEDYFQRVANGLEDAIKQSTQTGLPVSQFFRLADVDSSSMDFDKFMSLKHAYDASMDPKRKTNWDVYNALARLDPQQLRKQNIIDYLQYLAPTEFKEVEGWWRSAIEGKSKDAVVPEHVDNLIGSYVSGALKVDPKDKPVEFQTKKARLIQRYLQWKTLPANEGKPFLFTDVGTLAADLFRGDKKEKSVDEPVIVRVLAAQGLDPTSEAIARSKKEIKDDAKLVDKAWNYVSDEDIDADTRALIWADTHIPENLERIKQQLRDEKVNPEDRFAQIRRAVQNHAPPESEERTRRMNEEDSKARARGEANARAAQVKSEKKAAEDAAARAYAALPAWQRAADRLEAEAKRRADTDLFERTYRAEYDRIDAEQKAGTGFGNPRNSFPNEKAIKAWARARVEESRVERHKAIELQFAQDRTALQTFLDALAAGDSVALEVNKQAGYPVPAWPQLNVNETSFGAYQRARRAGKVF